MALATVEAPPLGDEILQLMATRLEAEPGYLTRTGPSQTLVGVVEGHITANGYDAATLGSIDETSLAGLGADVLAFYFENKAAQETSAEQRRVALENDRQARDRLFEIGRAYRGSLLRVTATNSSDEPIFRQTNTDYLNQRGKFYRAATGAITQASFASAGSNEFTLRLSGVRKWLATTTELRVRPFQYHTVEPIVKLELVA